MSIIIKSDKVAKNTIGNRYEVQGHNDFNLMLDFNRQEFFRVDPSDIRTDIQLSELVTCVRPSSATYTTRLGEIVQAEINEPRINYDTKTGVGGLLMERESLNYFANPENPVSQTVIIPANTQRFGITMVVYGSGYVQISGDMQVGVGTKVYQDKTFFSAVSLESGTGVLQLDVVGSVDFVQLEIVSRRFGENKATSKMLKQADGKYSRKREMTEITPSVAAEIAKSKTILFSYQMLEKGTNVKYSPQGNQSSLLLELRDASNPRANFPTPLSSPSSLQIRFTEKDEVTGANSFAIEKFPEAGSAEIPSRYIMETPNSRNITVAISHDGKLGNLVYAVNGTSSQTAFTGLPNFLTGVSFAGKEPSINGMLTKLVTFDKTMTAKELSELTMSWL